MNGRPHQPSPPHASADGGGGAIARMIGVHKAYLTAEGEQIALRGMTVALPAGIVGLLGPNGAGKSTMFRLMLGLERPDAGDVEVLGWPVATAGLAARAELGFMPEDDCLFPRLTALESVVHAARLCGVSALDATTAAHRTLDRVELGEHRYRPAAALSLGGRQRLRLAMALVHGPRLLLLDEPTAGLDPEARAEMLQLIREVARDGMSIVLSTHVLGDVEAVCDRVVIVSRGLAEDVGSPARFRGVARDGEAVELVLDQPAARVASALEAAGIEASADGDRLRVRGRHLPQEAWAVLARDAIGVRSLGPARDAMEEAFLRHLRLDDPARHRPGDAA